MSLTNTSSLKALEWGSVCALLVHRATRSANRIAFETFLPDDSHRSQIEGLVGQVETFRTLLGEQGDGKVLVVDGGGSRRCALVGDQIGALAVKNGWAGIVVYGCIRDSAIISTQKIGIRALDTHPRKSVKAGVGQRDLPLSFGGVRFSPGDWLYADADGILVAAKALI